VNRFAYWRNQAGASTGDGIIVASILTLGLALLYPSLIERRFEGRLDQAVADVETVRSAASGFLTANQDWPDPGVPGEASTQLAAALPADFVMRAAEYTVQWERWEVVQAPPAPEDPDPIVRDEEGDAIVATPPAPSPTFHSIGGVTVHSSNGAILAGLLARYGPGSSFVRDSTWTLVLPTRSASRGGA
jgi:hypothetical protein